MLTFQIQAFIFLRMLVKCIYNKSIYKPLSSDIFTFKLIYVFIYLFILPL